MTPKNPEISRPLTERLTELTSDLRRTQELAKGGLLPLERRSLAMLEELGLLHCRKEDAAVLPQEQVAFEAFGAAWERLRSVEEAVRAGDGPSFTHASAIQEMQVQARELKVALSAPALARAEAAEARVRELEAAWIPVSERLPEEDKIVLLHSQQYGIHLGTCEGGAWSREWESFIYPDVTHWQTLTDPRRPRWEPVVNGVLVDRELLERLAGHAESLSHADTTHEQRNAAAVDAAAALAALALPAQAAADAAGVLRLAADLIDAEQAWERARYGSPEALAAHGASWDAVKGMYQVGAPRLRALADALEVQG